MSNFKKGLMIFAILSGVVFIAQGIHDNSKIVIGLGGGLLAYGLSFVEVTVSKRRC